MDGPLIFVNLLFFLALESVLCPLFLVIFCALALRFQFCRDIFFRVVLPQTAGIVMMAGIWWAVGLVVSARVLLTVSPCYLTLIVVLALLFGKWLRSPLFVRLACHTIALMMLFFFFLDGLSREWHQHQDLQTVEQLEHAQPGDLARLADPQDEKAQLRLLKLAVTSSSVPESVLRELIKHAKPLFSVSSPCSFTSVGEDCIESNGYDTPFHIALKHYNVRVVRLLLPLLLDDIKKTGSYGATLAGLNPLEELYWNNDTPWTKYHAAALEISQLLITAIPDVVTDEAYEAVLNKADGAVLALMWRQHPPENRRYRLQAMMVIPQTDEVMAEVARDPTLLETNIGQYGAQKSLLDFAIQYGNVSAIQALIDAGAIDWRRFTTPGKPNILLAEANVRLQHGGGDEMLIVILRDMLKQKLPAEQLSYSIHANTQAIAAYLKAGLRCEDVAAMADNLFVVHDPQEGAGGLSEQCRAIALSLKAKD